MNLAMRALQPPQFQVVSALPLFLFSFCFVVMHGTSINLPEEKFHVCEMLLQTSLPPLSSLYSNGLDVPLNGRDYLWY